MTFLLISALLGPASDIGSIQPYWIVGALGGEIDESPIVDLDSPILVPEKT